MKKIGIGVSIISILLLGGAGCPSTMPTQNKPEQNQVVSTSTSSDTDVDTTDDTSDVDRADAQQAAADGTTNKNVRKLSLQPYAAVTSPLLVTGEAKGWYFEGSFPVELQNAAGKVLATGIGQAQSDWMSSDFVPFRVEMPFSVTEATAAFLVLKNDNESGLPENDQSMKLPVLLQPGSNKKRTIKLYYYKAGMDQDNDGNQKCSADGLIEFTKSIPWTLSPLQDAIKQLLAMSPTSDEEEQGIISEFPIDGFSLKSASGSNGVFTLTFSRPDPSVTLGWCETRILQRQIEATAKQFDTVKSLKLLPADLFQQ